MTFNEKRFREVWNNLSPKTQEAIKAKAQWEHMTLSAVMCDWWPRLWAKVVK